MIHVYTCFRTHGGESATGASSKTKTSTLNQGLLASGAVKQQFVEVHGEPPSKLQTMTRR